MPDAYLGEIRLVAFNFAPVGWAFCNGQILSISSNTALYSLLGTYYGGNGSSTFALPNLQSRVPICMGAGTGLSPYTIGQTGGTEKTTLLVNNMPAHNHPVQANNGAATSSNPSNAYLAVPQDNGGAATLAYAASPNTTMGPQSTGIVGSSLPFPNLPPFLALTYIIALQGIYPSRN